MSNKGSQMRVFIIITICIIMIIAADAARTMVTMYMDSENRRLISGLNEQINSLTTQNLELQRSQR